MPPNLGMWMPTGTSADVAPCTDFIGSPLAVGCCSTCSLDLGFFAAMPGPGGNPMAGHQAWAWWPARRPVGREGSWHPLSQKAWIHTFGRTVERCARRLAMCQDGQRGAAKRRKFKPAGTSQKTLNREAGGERKKSAGGRDRRPSTR